MTETEQGKKRRRGISWLLWLGLLLVHVCMTCCFGALSEATTTALGLFSEGGRAFGAGCFGATVATTVVFCLLVMHAEEHGHDL